VFQACFSAETALSVMELVPDLALIRRGWRIAMLVERGLKVMNAESVSEAYAIASNYLRRTGAIADVSTTNERLFEIIVEIFQAGEFNSIRLANKAIAQFETAELL
jgi:hypothetical protein